MINELERLLSNAHAPHDALCFSSVVVMKDGQTFGGVTVKNNIFRDAIYAEQAAIARAVAAGYKKKDFDKIIDAQRAVYEVMFENGWYVLEEADKSKIKEKYNMLCTELSDLEEEE